MKLTSVFAAVIVAMALTACGSDSSSGGGSCAISASGSAVSCLEFTGAAANAAAVQQACTQSSCSTYGPSGTTVTCAYSSGGCTATSRLGRCTVNYVTQTATGVVIHFYGTSSQATAAQQQCTQMGSATGVTASWQAG